MSTLNNAIVQIANVTANMVANVNLLIGPILNIYGKPIDATLYAVLQMYVELQNDPNFNENGTPTFLLLGSSIITPLKSGLVEVELASSDLQQLGVGSTFPIFLQASETGVLPPLYTLATGNLTIT